MKKLSIWLFITLLISLLIAGGSLAQEKQFFMVLDVSSGSISNQGMLFLNIPDLQPNEVWLYNSDGSWIRVEKDDENALSYVCNTAMSEMGKGGKNSLKELWQEIAQKTGSNQTDIMWEHNGSLPAKFESTLKVLFQNGSKLWICPSGTTEEDGTEQIPEEFSAYSEQYPNVMSMEGFRALANDLLLNKGYQAVSQTVKVETLQSGIIPAFYPTCGNQVLLVWDAQDSEEDSTFPSGTYWDGKNDLTVSASLDADWYLKPDAGAITLSLQAEEPFVQEGEALIRVTLSISPCGNYECELTANWADEETDSSMQLIMDPLETAANGVSKYQAVIPQKQSSMQLSATAAVSGIECVLPSVSCECSYPLLKPSNALHKNVPEMILYAGSSFLYTDFAEKQIRYEDYFSDGDGTMTVSQNNAEQKGILPIDVESDNGKVFRIKAQKAGSTHLLFTSGDGYSSVEVNVIVKDGARMEKLIAAIILAVLLLALALVCFAFFLASPRFRKEDRVRIELADHSVGYASLRPYRKKGVSVARLMLLSGLTARNETYYQAFQSVFLLPKRDGIKMKLPANVKLSGYNSSVVDIWAGSIMDLESNGLHIRLCIESSTSEAQMGSVSGREKAL